MASGPVEPASGRVGLSIETVWATHVDSGGSGTSPYGLVEAAIGV